MYLLRPSTEKAELLSPGNERVNYTKPTYVRTGPGMESSENSKGL